MIAQISVQAIIQLEAENTVLSSTGTVTAYQLFTPYGAVRYSHGTMPTSKGFTGQRLDPSGLNYFNARYYDATVGVFISADVAQGPNRYAYVGGNPETLTDPTGSFTGSGDYHLAVQFEFYSYLLAVLTNMYGNNALRFLCMECVIKNGSYLGRGDMILWFIPNRVGMIWEIKPITYRPGTKLYQSALDQLNGYITNGAAIGWNLILGMPAYYIPGAGPNGEHVVTTAVGLLPPEDELVAANQQPGFIYYWSRQTSQPGNQQPCLPVVAFPVVTIEEFSWETIVYGSGFTEVFPTPGAAIAGVSGYYGGNVETCKLS